MEDNENLQELLKNFQDAVTPLFGSLSGIVESAKRQATTPEEKAAIEKAVKDVDKAKIEIPKTFDGIGKMMSDLQDKMK